MSENFGLDMNALSGCPRSQLDLDKASKKYMRKLWNILKRVIPGLFQVR